MITYKFEARCERCGRKKVRAGVIAHGNALTQNWNVFLGVLAQQGWKLESKNDLPVEICPGCVKKAGK